jgi:hypothetical protein
MLFDQGQSRDPCQTRQECKCTHVYTIALHHGNRSDMISFWSNRYIRNNKPETFTSHHSANMANGHSPAFQPGLDFTRVWNWLHCVYLSFSRVLPSQCFPELYIAKPGEKRFAGPPSSKVPPPSQKGWFIHAINSSIIGDIINPT